MAIGRRFNESADDDAETHALENAVFCFPRMSTSTLKNLLTFNNSGCVVSVDEGSLTISGDSRFSGNTGAVGAVIVASRSDISVTGTQFEENNYVDKGGCLYLRDGSSASINSTVFSRNVANVATAIFADSLKFLDISDSHFEQDCKDCGGFIRVNGAFDAASAITISKSHLGPFEEFGRSTDDRSFGSFEEFGRSTYDRSLLFIYGFDDGHVLLESVDFGRQKSYNCSWGDADKNAGMVVVLTTRNVSFTSIDSSYTRAGGALGTGIRFSDSSGLFWIERAVFHEIDCCSGYGIFARFNPHHHSRLSVIDSEFSSNYFFGGTLFVTGHNCDVEVRGSRFISNTVENNRFSGFQFRATSILSVSDIRSLKVSNCMALNNTAIPGRLSKPILGSLYIGKTYNATIEGSTFVANSVGTRRGDSGGAVYFSSGMTLTVSNCTFEDNIAAGGGAIYADDIWGLSVVGSSFRNNNAIASGGAIVVVHQLWVISVVNSTFFDNRARIGGALALGIKNTSAIMNCTFSENKAELYGGAIAFMHIPTEETRESGISALNFMIALVEFFKNTAAFGGESYRA